LERQQTALQNNQKLLAALDPRLALQRGFAIIRDGAGNMLKSGTAVTADDIVHIEMKDALMDANVTQIRRKNVRS
jgi:exonuclease VII large subunit